MFLVACQSSCRFVTTSKVHNTRLYIGGGNFLSTKKTESTAILDQNTYLNSNTYLNLNSRRTAETYYFVGEINTNRLSLELLVIPNSTFRLIYFIHSAVLFNSCKGFQQLYRKNEKLYLFYFYFKPNLVSSLAYTTRFVT